jgi:hypothetical protein
MPPQHSALAAHTSPVCVQKEPFAQSPPVQNFEQQSAPVVHALPLVRQDGLSGAQTPPPQLPLQHCAELEQGWLSDVHCVPPQTPLSQTKVQQSWGMVHEPPAGLHWPAGMQILATESQLTEQHSALLVHASPT